MRPSNDGGDDHHVAVEGTTSERTVPGVGETPFDGSIVEGERPTRRKWQIEPSIEQFESDSGKTAPKSEIELLVGIPAYNEEIAIGSAVIGAARFADQVVVVDDGSDDETAAIAERAGAIVCSHGENRGKGAAIRTLLRYARVVDCRTLVLVDGDGQHISADIPHLAGPVLEERTDIVVGSRYLEKEFDETPRYRRVGQRLLNLLTTAATGTALTDSQSGFRALSRPAIRELSRSLSTDGMSVESDMIAAAADGHLEIQERPIRVRYRDIDGQTFNPLYHGLAVATFVLNLLRSRHPLLFFGPLGLGLVALGLTVGLQPLVGGFASWQLFVGGFATVLGSLFVISGVILHGVGELFGERADE